MAEQFQNAIETNDNDTDDVQNKDDGPCQHFNTPSFKALETSEGMYASYNTLPCFYIKT